MQHDLLDLARKSTIDFDDLRKNKPSFLLGISPASHGWLIMLTHLIILYILKMFDG